MDRLTKVFFDPLLTAKDDVESFIKDLPVGSAHPYRPDGVLFLHSAAGTVTEVDISIHPEEYISNAISLADVGEGILTRMEVRPSYTTLRS